ncbi:glycosyl hydrolase [Georgenia sp. MJ173]|uniref:glycosyl hydrolase n=1 Tax=Georgenia sunbinii TaxID=3117728 RepID=UPI002F26858A
MSRNSRWRRALVGATATALIASASMTGAANAESVAAVVPAGTPATSAFAEELESRYIDPDRIYSTDVRWWLGEAAHTDETLLEEIQALYDSGFRGVELAMQDDLAADDADYAYGSQMWAHKWSLMMNKLLDLGMSVYLTSGTNWATSNVPGLDPTSQAAMQNLTLGTGTVAAGERLTALPTPDAEAQHDGASLVTAYAYRIVGGDVVAPDSFVDLSDDVAQGDDAWTQNLDWTTPDDGTYRVFGIWTQGTFQASDPSVEPAYTTNYFDERGVEALKEFWEAHYLADPALAAKIAEGDVQLFMDSLEIHPGGGSEFEGPISTQPQFTFWAEDMAEEFEARKGYDITPHLFLIRGVKANVYDPYHSVDKTGIYRLDGAEDRRQEIINDFQDVQTQLYRERMLQPLKEWLNSVGIETRAQISYGKPFENSEPAMDVDYPEAENFNQYNQVDIFRLWTGAAKLENKVLSTETGAQMPPFSATAQMNLRDAYAAYGAGFQRVIWHVWAADYGYGNHEWPGFDPFRFANAFRYFGGRDPGAADYDEFNAHLGRVQQLLQTGKSRTDVGFVHQDWFQGVRFGGGIEDDNAAMNWQLAHQGVYYRSTELQDNGYTYDYFSPNFLFDDDVSFDPETQTIENAGYQALVLYQDWLDVDGAQRILDWAKQGLKVVILEDAASRTPFNDGEDDELQAIVDELKTLETVRTAEVFDAPEAGYFSAEPGGYDDNVMEKLHELGVYPYAGYPEENLQLLTQTRQDEAGNRYVFAYNYGDDEYHQYSHKEDVRDVEFGTNIQTDIEMDGQYIPYVIDAWTGEVVELADYRWEDGRTVVPVDVDQYDIELLAFEKVDEGKLHIDSTDAESAYAVPDGVAVRATESGDVTTTLSDGRQFSQPVTVPEAYDVTDWDLTVQSWRPNDVAGDLVRTETIDGLTTVNRKTSTLEIPIDVELETLTTWNNIPEVGMAVSGTGHYEATFDWDADAASGAYLDFGDTLESSMKVWINGEKVGGHVSTNPTKVTRDVGGVAGPTIDDGTGQQVPLVGDDLYTGGLNWMDPQADISPYLVDGENEIVIEYNSVLSNVQLDRGVVSVDEHRMNWWKNTQDYLEFGPRQAVITPFVEVAYSAETPTEEPTDGPTEDPTDPGTGPTDGPTDPGTDPSTPPPSGDTDAGDGDLPSTGAELAPLLAAAILLVLGGAATAVVVRRRSQITG